MATGTTNPPGSNDPRDLRANAENLDLLITGPALNYPDRLGVSRRSWAGIDASYEEAEAQRDVVFQDHLTNTGYELPSIPYAAGILIERETQLIERMGEFYRAKPGVVPFTTTGTWATDEANLVAVGDAALRQELAGVTGSELVYDQQADGPTFSRPIKGKLDALASVKDYGSAGTGNGVTSDHLAAVAMGAALGYIHFSRGNYVLDTCTLSYPVSFDKKASVTVNAGQTLTINNTIDSPKQHIFKGAGTYVLGHSTVTDTGENARQVHASWFGAFPDPDSGPDQAPAIQAACNAVGNGRESIIDFDIGNYNMASSVTLTRGCWIRGSGSRRTVFKTQTDGFPYFITGNTACRLSGFNCEIDLGVISTRNSSFIQVDHDACLIQDVALGQTAKGIVVNALRCRIYDIVGAYGNTQPAGSSLIELNIGQADIKNVSCNSSGLGVDAVVSIGLNATGNISDFQIGNIDSSLPSRLVSVKAVNGNISNIQVNGLRYSGSAGPIPSELLLFQNENTRTLTGVQVDGLFTTGYIPNVVNFSNLGTARMGDCTLDNINATTSATGYGVWFNRASTGALDNIVVSDTVQVKGRTTPFQFTGSPTKILIGSAAIPDAVNVFSRDFTLADDTAVAIPLNRSVFTGMLHVTSGSVGSFVGGSFVVRAAATPGSATLSTVGSIGIVNTALTGTTSTDGRVTIGVTDGVLYLENRLGSSQRLSLTLMTGVA